MKNLKVKQILIVVYHLFSWATLSINDEAPLWIIALIVLSFGNSVRLVNKLPIKNKHYEKA